MFFSELQKRWIYQNQSKNRREVLDSGWEQSSIRENTGICLRAYWTESQQPLYLSGEAGIQHHWERNIPRWNPKTTSSPDAYLRSKKQTQRRRNTSGWCNWIQKDKHQKWMLVLLYPTHYVKMCSRCSILLSHSLLESAHSFSSVSTSAFIGKFFL